MRKTGYVSSMVLCFSVLCLPVILQAEENAANDKAAELRRIPSQIDANGNGVIDGEERKAWDEQLEWMRNNIEAHHHRAAADHARSEKLLEDLSTTGSAATAGPDGDSKAFRGKGLIDRNRDGYVSKKERKEWTQRRLERFDLNGDGTIDKDEEAQALAQEKNVDTNGDGLVDDTERNAWHEKNLALFDRNHDGTIDQSERQTARDEGVAQQERAVPTVDLKT